MHGGKAVPKDGVTNKQSAEEEKPTQKCFLCLKDRQKIELETCISCKRPMCWQCEFSTCGESPYNQAERMWYGFECGEYVCPECDSPCLYCHQHKCKNCASGCCFQHEMNRQSRNLGLAVLDENFKHVTQEEEDAQCIEEEEEQYWEGM